MGENGIPLHSVQPPRTPFRQEEPLPGILDRLDNPFHWPVLGRANLLALIHILFTVWSYIITWINLTQPHRKLVMNAEFVRHIYLHWHEGVFVMWAGILLYGILRRNRPGSHRWYSMYVGLGGTASALSLVYFSGLTSGPFSVALVASWFMAILLMDNTEAIVVISLNIVAYSVLFVLELRDILPSRPLFQHIPIEDGDTPFWWDLTNGLFVWFLTLVIAALSTVIIFRLRTREQKLQKLSSHDALTGLLNHGALMDALQREIARSKRTGRPFSFLMADLDHFKAINDQYGHLSGDRILAETSGALAETVRAQDMVGRYGGEEFGIILPETGLEQAEAAAERCRNAVEKNGVLLDGAGDIHVTISIGCASWEIAADESPGELIKRADEALYQAKRGGRNCVALAPVPPAEAVSADQL